MKKLTAIIIAALFALALTACGAEPLEPPASPGSLQPESQVDTGSIKSDFEKGYDYVQSLIKSDSVQADKFEDDPEYLYCMWTFLDAPPDVTLSDDIEIGGQKITFGKTLVKDLEGMGFELIKPSDTVEPDEIFGILLNKDGKSVNVETYGRDQPQPADDLPVYGFTGGREEFVIPYNYNGLSAASTLKDVLDIMGEPNGDIRLTSDSMETVIEIDYVSEQTLGDRIEQKQFSVTFTYDVENNTSVVTSLNLSRNYYSADMMME